MRVLKRLCLEVCFIVMLFCISTNSMSQSQDKHYDRELVTFMNYVRDSVLKTDTWATRPYFKQIGTSGFFGTENYKPVWKPLIKGSFSNKELSYISRQIMDTTPYMLSEEMVRRSYKQPETMSYDFYQLSVAKFYIENYTAERYKVDENNVAAIDVDTAIVYGRLDSTRYGDNTKIAAQYSALFNHSIEELQAYIKRLRYTYQYRFARPIFLRNYHYCILIYSFGEDVFNGSGKIQIFKKKNKKWTLYKTFIKRFSTGIDVY